MHLNCKRRLTVGRIADGTHRDGAASLRICGEWLYLLGFAPGDVVTVECRDGSLIVRHAEPLQLIPSQTHVPDRAAG